MGSSASADKFWLPVVDAILKGGKDKLAGRSVIDGSSAVVLLALFFVPLPHGA